MKVYRLNNTTYLGENLDIMHVVDCLYISPQVYGYASGENKVLVVIDPQTKSTREYTVTPAMSEFLGRAYRGAGSGNSMSEATIQGTLLRVSHKTGDESPRILIKDTWFVASYFEGILF